MTVPDPQAFAVEYDVTCLPYEHPSRRHFTVKVSRRGADVWAVCDIFGYCLGADGQWIHERSLADLSDEGASTHRFTLDRALALAEEHAALMEVNGLTVEDVLAKERRR